MGFSVLQIITCSFFFFFFLHFTPHLSFFLETGFIYQNESFLFVGNNCMYSSKPTKTNYSCYLNLSTCLGSHPDSSGTAAAAARGNRLPEVCSYSCSHNSTFAQMCTWSSTCSSTVILSHQPVCILSIDYFCSQAFSEHFCNCTSEVVIMVCNRPLFLFHVDHTHKKQKHNSYLKTGVLVFRLHFFWCRMSQCWFQTVGCCLCHFLYCVMQMKWVEVWYCDFYLFLFSSGIIYLI